MMLPTEKAAAESANGVFEANSRFVIIGSNTVSAAKTTINWKETIKIMAPIQGISMTVLNPSRISVKNDSRSLGSLLISSLI